MRIAGWMACTVAIALASGCGAPEPAGSSRGRTSSKAAGSGGGESTYPETGGSGGGPGTTGTGGTIGPINPVGDGGPGAFGVFTEAVVLADPTPPPISGGTLTLIAQGHKAAVSDPDRDQVIVVDLDAMSVAGTIALRGGDEPGRLVEDSAGRVHVVLRGAGVIATLDAATGVEVRRFPVCSHPRGLAYDAKADALHVACAGGELVTFRPSGGAPTRVLRLDRDLRDVVVDGNRLLVSRFRAAELLVVEATGEVSSRLSPLDPPPRIPGEPVTEPVGSHPPPPLLAAGQPVSPEEPPLTPRVPAVAWRTIAAPGGGAIMVFQLAQVGEVKVVPGGWGGRCRHVVDTAVSWVRAEGLGWSVENVPAVLPVDVAASSDGLQIAVASAAIAPGLSFQSVGARTVFQQPSLGARSVFNCGGGGGESPLAPDVDPIRFGRVVALAFDPAQQLVFQTREPSMLVVGNRSVVLPGESRKHTGHELFHLGTAGGVACASCHPEGQEDGQVWTFAGVGDRRTQAISGGILGTEPFHWTGDMADFDTLIHDVFNGRMSGPSLQVAHLSALAQWIDQLPRPKPAAPADPAAAGRGRVLFDDPEIGCATCHAGAKMTNNANVDVQTGGVFQVPSLLGLGFRAPYMHQGCAATLADRFGSCGGGDGHGHTSGLTAENQADLIAYLETL